MSLLGECFVPAFLLPHWRLGKCASYLLPGRKFSVDLFPLPLSWCVPNVCMLVFEAGILGLVGGRKIGDLCDPLGMRRQEQETTAGFHLQAGDETGEIGSGGAEGKCGSPGSLLVAQTGTALGLAVGICCSCGLGQSKQSGKGVKRRRSMECSADGNRESRKGCRQCSAAELWRGGVAICGVHGNVGRGRRKAAASVLLQS